MEQEVKPIRVGKHEYSNSNIMIDNNLLKVIKEVSLPRILANFGIHPVREKDLTREHLSYVASYRNEKTPSLSVFKSNNGQWLYRDHATDETGTNIDLLVRFGFFSNWREAATYVAEKYLGRDVDSLSYMPRLDPLPKHLEHPVARPQPSGIIHEISSIVGSPAEKYIVKTRRVPISVASLFVCFARYSNSPGGKVFSGIAWQTFRGGWSVRWAIDLGPGKGKAFVGPGGFSFFPVVNDSRSETCTLFEGMFDALSFVTLHGWSSDIIVLNSVDNVNETLDLLDTYQRVYGYLDADDPGRNCWKAVVGRCGAKAIDSSSEFAGYKDLNDYLKTLIINQ